MTAGGARQFFDITTFLVRRRQDLGITQDELANRVRRSRKTVVQWEGGHESPGAKALCAWAAALGVSLTPVTSP